MTVLLAIQLIVSVILISAILLQSRGTGLGSAFGGEGKSYHSKRGMEQVLFKATILLAILFVGLSLFALI